MQPLPTADELRRKSTTELERECGHAIVRASSAAADVARYQEIADLIDAELEHRADVLSASEDQFSPPQGAPDEQ